MAKRVLLTLIILLLCVSAYADVTKTVGTGKTFGTIQAAVDDITGDLTGQGVVTVEVYATTANTYNENIDCVTGFSNESAADYIIIKSMVAHDGKAQISGGTGIKITIKAAVGVTKIYMDAYSIFDGFEVTQESAITVGAYLLVGYGKFRNCILHDCTSVTPGVWIFGITFGNNGVAENCVVYNLSNNEAGAGNECYGLYPVSYTGVKYYNCTVYNIQNISAGGGYGFRAEAAGSVILTNNVISTCKTACYSSLGSTITATYNVSSDLTADDWGGAGNQTSKALGDIDWVSTTGGSEDFHIQNTSCLYDMGATIGSFSTDFEGTTRPQNVAWDIGADELLSGILYKPFGILFSHNDLPVGYKSAQTSVLHFDLDGDLHWWRDTTDTVELTLEELSQIANIGAEAISATEWGYLAALNQSLTTGASPMFVDLTLSGAISASTNITASGTITGGTLAQTTAGFISGSKFSKSFIISNPTATADLPVWRTPVAITITAVHLLCKGNVVVGQLWEYDANGLNGAVVDDTDITGVVDTNVDGDTPPSNPSIDANDYVGWVTTSVTGTPTYAIITFEGYYN